MKRTILFFFLFFVSFAGNAFSCEPEDQFPCKKLRIYNNHPTDPLNPANERRIYAFIQSYIQTGGDHADLWLQAYFKIIDWDSNFISPRKFATTRLRRGYIEIGNDEGIAPGQWVEVTIPFYTKLLPVTEDDRGKIPDQYIDWWNSGRVYFFDSQAAYHSVKVTNAINPPPPAPPIPGAGLPPAPVTVLANARVPSCTSSDGKKCSVPLFENAIEPLSGIPFQLQEYSLASAEGPPLNTSLPGPTKTKIDLSYVNYNVSSLDSVFLPVAMGPLTKAGDSVNLGVTPPVPVPYVGTSLTTHQFRQTLKMFSNDGNNWPFFVPAYYDDMDHPGFPSSSAKACSLAPFTLTSAYRWPKLPGAFNVLTESYQGARLDDKGNTVYPPVPPVLNSNPRNYKDKYTTNACTLPTPAPFVDPPKRGVAGKAFIELWNKCYPSTLDTSQTCKDIRTVADLFLNKSYFANPACKTPVETPPFYITMQAVYGWVPIVNRGCTGVDLKTDVTAYKDAALAYCRLQYNYVTLPQSEKAVYTFNPYTALIHAPYSPVFGGGLKSSAYAFSIDDKLSFKHVVADGIILTIAGTHGLEFDPMHGETAPVATKIPKTAQEIVDHCKLD